MIRWHDVRFAYPGSDERPALPSSTGSTPRSRRPSWSARRTDAGRAKSTLLRTVNGLVPAFTGGVLSGDVRVAGESVVGVAPRELAHLVGHVAQDPLPLSSPRPSRRSWPTAWSSSASTPHDASPCGGDPRPARHPRPARPAAARALRRAAAARGDRGGPDDAPAGAGAGRAHLGPRPVPRRRTCSARWRGSCTTSASRSWWPSTAWSGSCPSPTACSCSRTGGSTEGPAAGSPRDSTVAPPLVELGRLAGWQPLPLTVRDARRRTPVLRERLADPVRAYGARGRGRARGRRRGRPLRPDHRGLGRLAAGAGRGGRGPDGPQRLRQVLAAVGAPGRPPAGAGAGRRGRQGPRCRARGGGPAAGRAGAADRVRPALPRHGRGGVPRRRPPGRECPTAPARCCSTGWCPGSTSAGTPATCRRDSGSRSCSPSCSPPTRPSSLSTSRPAAWTTTAKRALADVLAELAAGRGARSWWRRTTSSSPPRSPTACWSWPGARSSPRARPRPCSRSRPPSRPRSPRCWARRG